MYKRVKVELSCLHHSVGLLKALFSRELPSRCTRLY
jgi:hypothetical protein